MVVQASNHSYLEGRKEKQKGQSRNSSNHRALAQHTQDPGFNPQCHKINKSLPWKISPYPAVKSSRFLNF
jgi:hypothetical protein